MTNFANEVKKDHNLFELVVLDYCLKNKSSNAKERVMASHYLKVAYRINIYILVTRTVVQPETAGEELRDEKHEGQLAKDKLSLLWDIVKANENNDASARDLLLKAGTTQEEFEKYFGFITKRNTVVLKRKANELYINRYDKHLLRSWNANMDIQYVLDAFSCVVYIISYISKSERELGLLLQ